MTKFVIQAANINGYLIPAFDFCYEAIQAITYQNWYRNSKDFDFVLVEKDSEKYYDYIPIGSVEFVVNRMCNKYKLKNIRPLNIPEELFPFAKRKIANLSRDKVWDEFSDCKRVFVKSNNKIKEFTDILERGEYLPNISNFQVSEEIEILTEWRCFVKNEKLLDIKCYSGDIDIFPNIKEIKKMIASYNNAPPAYTIDVAVNDKGETVIIECHNFFSCGLYGFSDYRYLLDMFIKAYYWQIDHAI